MSDVDGGSAVPKVEPYEEDEFSDSDQEPEDPGNTQEPAQVQKRKGGRKPIYATSEERKQRNRQAQAAFRERRTEYIKQLETTIKHHEDTLQSLQQSHRSAADECLMLRYKNSLLERILLEKGIDVQAELKVKTEGSHVLSQSSSATAPFQHSAVHKAVMNRHNQPRRNTSGSGAKSLRPQQLQNISQPPRSHSTSSTTMSPVTGHSPHGVGKAPPMPDGKGQARHQHPIQPRTHAPQAPSHPGMPRTGAPMQPLTSATADEGRGSDIGSKSGTGTQAGFYAPGYQAHLDQLEREYDAHAESMLDDGDSSDTPNGPSSNGPGPYPHPHNYHTHPNMPPGTAVPMGMQAPPPMQPMPPQMHPQHPQHSQHPQHQQHAQHSQHPQQVQQVQQQQQRQPVDPNNPMYGIMNQSFDAYDPNLDSDPFGLTASMHFPTQFTYPESVRRR